MQVYLETERLTLRRFTAADADNLVALDSDPDVMRYLSGGAPTPRAMIERELLPRWLAYYDRRLGFGHWAAIERAGGDFLGWFGFHPTDGADPGEVELGYRLRRAAWGRGYATEGSRALLRKGFAELGVRRVVASTYQDNFGSRRVMEKVGMTLVRSYRPTLEELAAHGTYDTAAALLDLFPGDDVEYALERADWARREAAGDARDDRAG
ncbi:MAG TPA: GNAT family N-acetyltransferase [Thermomicrobiales bacterium]|nr:GNAT family N-acetyltransferase [Thermomicrobiales bacterium]